MYILLTNWDLRLWLDPAWASLSTFKSLYCISNPKVPNFVCRSSCVVSHILSPLKNGNFDRTCLNKKNLNDRSEIWSSFLQIWSQSPLFTRSEISFPEPSETGSSAILWNNTGNRWYSIIKPGTCKRVPSRKDFHNFLSEKKKCLMSAFLLTVILLLVIYCTGCNTVSDFLWCEYPNFLSYGNFYILFLELQVLELGLGSCGTLSYGAYCSVWELPRSGSNPDPLHWRTSDHLTFWITREFQGKWLIVMFGPLMWIVR